MKPAPFTYHRPASLGEATSLLADTGDEARVLAGGQSLVPLMNFRLAQPGHLVDIARIEGLDHIREEDGQVAIGAMARQSALEESPAAARGVPLLVEAVTYVGHPPIRHQGTVCGSLAHADPAAELPTALLAQGGELVLVGKEGERRVGAEEFFVGPFTTAVAPGELVREVRAQRWPDPAGHAFVEYSRRHGDFAVAGAAVLVRLEAGRIERAAIALCGVGDRPGRATAAEQLLVGARGTPEELDAAAEAAAESLHPPSDLHGGASYRRRVARTCTRRALASALGRARETR